MGVSVSAVVMIIYGEVTLPERVEVRKGGEGGREELKGGNSVVIDGAHSLSLFLTHTHTHTHTPICTLLLLFYMFLSVAFLSEHNKGV